MTLTLHRGLWDGFEGCLGLPFSEHIALFVCGYVDEVDEVSTACGDSDLSEKKAASGWRAGYVIQKEVSFL